MRPRVVILEAIHQAGVERMRQFAEVDVRLGLSRRDLLSMVGDVEGVVVKSTTAVDEEFLRAAKRLRCIGRAGVGVDNIDVAAAKARGIPVITTPDQNTTAVAEFTIGLIIVLARNIDRAATNVESGDFRRHLLEGRELAGMSVGIVGVGRAGMAVAHRLHAFGCKLLGFDPSPRDPAGFERIGGRFESKLETLFARADLVTLHPPLIDQTRGLIGRKVFAAARPGLLLVNTSRGPVVDDAALLEALASGQVARAAVDVLFPEPPFDKAPGHNYEHPLLHNAKILVTPHLAASTEEAQRRIATELADAFRHLLGAHDEMRKAAP